MNNNHLTLEASFTPDSKYVMSGDCLLVCTTTNLYSKPSIVYVHYIHTTGCTCILTLYYIHTTGCTCILTLYYIHTTGCTCILTLYYIHTTGSQDGTVHVWSSETGQKVTVLDGGHPGPTYNLQFNPKFMMTASACNSVVRMVLLQCLPDRYELSC